MQYKILACSFNKTHENVKYSRDYAKFAEANKNK